MLDQVVVLQQIELLHYAIVAQQADIGAFVDLLHHRNLILNG